MVNITNPECKGVVTTELLKNAVTGVNIIPTALLGLILLYWITVIIGAFDFDFLDIDMDIGADNSGPFYAILAFLNVGELPFMLILSIFILNFWILSMLMYYLPFVAVGGLLNGILLIPAMIISIFITKYETIPLKGIFKYSNMQDNRNDQVTTQLCILMCDVKDGRLGQAKIKRDGASIVINVKSEYDEETFNKDETAFVNRKDTHKDIYYIVKLDI
ncbi:hypothetical protein SH1V18_43770 [Vallitalea longa]|uniref:Inner membrane protein YqiJ N-terminal domain-containing protein n=1 Tax=Vallitalea longa TaxID=2936439 RepID=A0A9W5YDD7_9FIRM|nr:OB-fold-containig protein [Vallitalea longa]GKX31897.1 hypothetical protein SH1V18_43770 [Vallitalea longa]